MRINGVEPCTDPACPACDVGPGMTPVYGCITCGTARPSEKDWDWITRHRGLGCPRAVWGLIEEEQ